MIKQLLQVVLPQPLYRHLFKEQTVENNFIYSEEQLMARLKFFIGICLSLTLFGIVFVVLYSLIFVTQPLNAISPIDQKFFELIVPIATFLTGTLSGIMLAGTSKEDKEAMLEAQKRAESNFEATKKMMTTPPPAPAPVAPMGMGMGFGSFSSPLAEATKMPVFEAGDPTHRNSRND
jgi:hypothetical protein